MQRLRGALEQLDEMISSLEDRMGMQIAERRAFEKKAIDQIKACQTREAGAKAVSQKVASRLDQTIRHVERILSERAS